MHYLELCGMHGFSETQTAGAALPYGSGIAAASTGYTLQWLRMSIIAMKACLVGFHGGCTSAAIVTHESCLSGFATQLL